ncbi:hypothetical protein GGR56DRAFT_179771 [Xylariaceae sp. FL0804]|nr:hypothetical protein GGR56DRAFT_179771 [Xylariaceae sp. FL0804]
MKCQWDEVKAWAARPQKRVGARSRTGVPVLSQVASGATAVCSQSAACIASRFTTVGTRRYRTPSLPPATLGQARCLPIGPCVGKWAVTPTAHLTSSLARSTPSHPKSPKHPVDAHGWFADPAPEPTALTQAPEFAEFKQPRPCQSSPARVYRRSACPAQSGGCPGGHGARVRPWPGGPGDMKNGPGTWQDGNGQVSPASQAHSSSSTTADRCKVI